MSVKKNRLELSPEEVRWRLAPKSLGFKTTAEAEAAKEIIGQKRGVEAFRFGMGMAKKGYNIFVTGRPGTGRLSTVKRLLSELPGEEKAPDDLCYVNNFKNPEAPILLRFPAGKGSEFKKAQQEFLDAIKREVPQLFESEDYVARKNQMVEAHERQVMEFYKAMEEKVKDTGLVVVRMQVGSFSRPDVVPLVDNEPKRLMDLEDMVEKGRFPKEELERLKETRERVKEELDEIAAKVRALQKDMGRKAEEVDRDMFTHLAEEFMKPVREAFPDEKVGRYLDSVISDMVENLDRIKMLGGGQAKGGPQAMMMGAPPPEIILHPYQANLMVDNADLEGPPVIVESYPTYRNLFGSIERIMDRQGGYRTDFTKIKAGSFVKANGGYLVVNLMDAIFEPGVWQTLKRSLKTELIEIETYDPYYFITATGLKPEPIKMEVKVVVLGDPYLYSLLRRYDPDTAKIFKVRADYESAMDRTDESVAQVASFVASRAKEQELRPFAASGVALVVEQAVRMAGRREKLSTAFPLMADLLAEADYFAGLDKAEAVEAAHVQQALDARVYRSDRIEQLIQEMIDRGSLMVDTEGEAVGQVNGLAVYSMGDHAFGKPSRITVSTAMGREGIINIEREADLSGPTHNKGVLILAGNLRRMFAQDKPLSLSASIAFEQSYGGVDGDSASSTELYALLSSLSGAPLRQDVAVTGSVNQMGRIQPIGGVNEKIEGFYHCCRSKGLTGTQGVLIPKPNQKDLMLKPEVVQAIAKGEFHVWAVETIEQGIEILTGRKAGVRTKTGAYTKGSVLALADARLKALAEGLRAFAGGEEGKKKGGKKRRSSPKS